MCNAKLIRKLESETSVLFEEWKELATLLYLTREKPLKTVLKQKYQLSDRLAEFITTQVTQGI